MIQTKTLKEALKDPGVIEVVEELIGLKYYFKSSDKSYSSFPSGRTVA
jgi:hypothetical protein